MFDFDSSEDETPRKPAPQVQLATHSSSRLKMHKKTSSSRKRSRSDHNNNFATNRSPEVYQNQNSGRKRSSQKRDKIVQDPRRVSFSKLKKSSTSSYKTSRHFSSPNLNKAMSASNRLEQSSQIPNGISEPRDLFWHVKMPMGKTLQQYRPCFIVKSTQKGNASRLVLDSSDDSDSDEEEEVQIQYLSCTSKEKNIYVMPKRLVPFHGRRNNDFDHDDYGRLNWNKEHIKSYLDNLSKHDAEQEKIYLKKVLAEARKRGGYKIKIDGNIDKQDVINIDEEEDASHSSEGSDSDELEEPYTQALPDDFEMDIDDIPIMKKTLNKKSTEPIRPGDIIEYYSPIFGFGE